MSKIVQSRISPKKIRSQSRASVRNRKHARSKHPITNIPIWKT